MESFLVKVASTQTSVPMQWVLMLLLITGRKFTQWKKNNIQEYVFSIITWTSFWNILPQLSGDFDLEAHPELKKPPNASEETSFFYLDKNILRSYSKKFLEIIQRLPLLIQ